MNRKIYEFPLELKSIEESGYFTGYASVFNVEDNHNDIILPGSFTKALQKKKSAVGNFLPGEILWMYH